VYQGQVGVDRVVNVNNKEIIINRYDYCSKKKLNKKIEGEEEKKLMIVIEREGTDQSGGIRRGRLK